MTHTATTVERLIHKMCQEFLNHFGWEITHIRYGSTGDSIEDHKSFSCVAIRNGEIRKLYCCTDSDRMYETTESIPGIGCYRIEDPHFPLTPEYIKNHMPAYKEVSIYDL
jgi:hypothetical protein